MKNSCAVHIAPGKKPALSKIATGAPKTLTKESAVEKLHELGQELKRLQELLYAAGMHSLLLVLQGTDTSGKDGAIRGVMDFVNP